MSSKQNSKQDLLEIVKSLSQLPGVSGSEAPVREAIEKLIEGCADSVTTDALGNLIVFKKGSSAPKQKLLLSAHMDEVGFIVTSVTDGGYLRVAAVGGIDSRVVLGKAVEVGPERIPGVIGSKAVHQQSEADRETPVAIDKLYVDIGAESREKAEEAVSPGDRVLFVGPWLEVGEGNVLAKALDDRAGCAIMVDLIRSDLPYDCWFSFTVQEETGCTGAVTAAYSIMPDIAVAIETTTASDIAGTPEGKEVCHFGRGPVISFQDRGTVYDSELYRFALNLAKENNIPVQSKTVVAGGNESRSLQIAGAGAKVMAISMPCRYLHSPSCMLRASDIENTKALLLQLQLQLEAGHNTRA